MYFRSLISAVFFLFLSQFSSAQNHNLDSLLSALKTSKEDTTKINILNSICREQKNIGDFEKANQYGNQALLLAKRLSFKKGEAKAYNNLGIIFESQGDAENALKNYMIALKIREEISDINGISGSYNNIGNIYYGQGNYSAALKNYYSSLLKRTEMGDKNGMAMAYMNIGNVYHLQGNYSDALKNEMASLKIREDLGDKQGIANCYNNIGNVYYSQSIYTEALKNQLAALKLRKEIGDENGIGSSYNNIGIIYYLQGNYSDALINQLASLKIMNKIGDKRGIAMSYSNIGIIYKNQGNYDDALQSQLASLKIAIELQDKNAIANCYSNIGIVYSKLGKFKEANENLNKGLSISKEIGAKDYIKDSYSGLAELDSARAASFGNPDSGPGKFWKAAFEHHKLAILYRDSLVNQETSKKLVESQMQYEFDKKESIAKAEQEKKDALTIAERRKQTIILAFVGFVAFLILCFAVFAYRNFRQKQKANNLLEEKNIFIEKQKLIVEEKNHEITDSINYARRIQQAILAPMKEIEAALPDSFVLFKPKDIVSGDFYWFANDADSKTTFIAAADCTGHGVPGAIMSMLSIDKLNEVLYQANTVSQILSLVNKGIKKALRQSDKDNSTRDGMDIALISLTEKTPGIISLNYAGANRPLWIARKNIIGSALVKEYKVNAIEDDLGEIKPTKSAIGGLTIDEQEFQEHSFDLEKGDTIYICTDGFADQFSRHGKKLKTKKFKEILLSIQDRSMKEQEKYLNDFIEDWRGYMEQTDDILVIGIRI